jgi:hypothetical protein
LGILDYQLGKLLKKKEKTREPEKLSGSVMSHFAAVAA